MLLEIADFLESQGVEYKPCTYQTTARNLESLSEDIGNVHQRGDIEEIESVGECISEKIGDYIETDEMEYYEELNPDLPVEIEAITRGWGGAQKSTKRLYLELIIWQE